MCFRSRCPKTTCLSSDSRAILCERLSGNLPLPVVFGTLRQTLSTAQPSFVRVSRSTNWECIRRPVGFVYPNSTADVYPLNLIIETKLGDFPSVPAIPTRPNRIEVIPPRLSAQRFSSSIKSSAIKGSKGAGVSVREKTKESTIKRKGCQVH
ncbi:hypothetical protein BDM02DRAFT_731172 [Thelephora ganbajun]|uniref:Uncharacterized protein n=1 Tax=Thelephora ganbajun TaxID=370292 RepID=A0ACB6ZP88_THEGA|nr:hypothetical protein BDM02DRAFT_731172 [Thelephora ganbajun]